MKALEHRIPPPLVALLVAAAMYFTARYTLRVEMPDGARLALAIGFWALGVVISVSALSGFRSAKTTVNPVDIKAASSLVTGGIYRISRNPMYLGLTTLLIGWSAYLAAPWTLLGVAAFVLFIQRFQVRPEERVMQEKFGAAYDEYRRRVRRWL